MNAMMKPFEDGQFVYLMPSEISIVDGFNPRRYFDPAAAKELEESIKAEGVQQNLVVRPDPNQPGRYLLIAGERRLRAAIKVGLDQVPVLVRHVNEREALVIALHENDKRQNISPAEEAQKAQQMLDACDGDRAEAARLLGWSRSRLDARLLLLHAHDSVLEALAERKIKLGIAELLCGLPKSAQEKNLPTVIEKGYSVAELRQKIESMAQKLGSAIFDTKDCKGCPHNSSTQASLFDDGLSDGQCMGRSCFADKTRAALDAKKSEMQGQYNAVFLDIEKPAGSWVLLTTQGGTGVGKEQYEACKGCGQFGALLSSEPGCEGQVQENICFDPLCHAVKHKLFEQSVAAAQSARQTKSKKPVKASAGKSAAVSSTPKKVRELAVNFLREQAAGVSNINPAIRRSLALYALINHSGKLALISPNESMDKALSYLHSLDDGALDKIEIEVCDHLLRDYSGSYGDGQQYEEAAIATLVTTDQVLTGRFKLNREFLEAHTKSGIEALMREATNPSGQTFAQWWEENRGPFKKLVAKKNQDLIQSILESGFDFSRWVPACITKEVDKMKAKLQQSEEKA